VLGRKGKYSIAENRQFRLRQAMATLEDRKAFIRANTRVGGVAGLDLSIWQADELTPIWSATEKDLASANLAPPFWAFPWAGGQALAHYLTDHPEAVRGKRVLDLASGSGLVAIAAAKAGASITRANDIDPMCEAAIALNGELNGVTVEFVGGDLLSGTAGEADVVLAADVFYEQTPAQRFLAFLRRAHAAGVVVFAGDPGRTYFPRDAFRLVGQYDVATSTEIENKPVKTARVWTL
jgi:predicted nicotinamide N-methyase